MADYGDMIVTRVGHRVVIDRADSTIGIAVELLADVDTDYVHTDSAGNLVFCGQVIYRPIRFDLDGRVVVCERVDQ